MDRFEDEEEDQILLKRLLGDAAKNVQLGVIEEVQEKVEDLKRKWDREVETAPDEETMQMIMARMKKGDARAG